MKETEGTRLFLELEPCWNPIKMLARFVLREDLEKILCKELYRNIDEYGRELGSRFSDANSAIIVHLKDKNRALKREVERLRTKREKTPERCRDCVHMAATHHYSCHRDFDHLITEPGDILPRWCPL